MLCLGTSLVYVHPPDKYPWLVSSHHWGQEGQRLHVVVGRAAGMRPTGGRSWISRTESMLQSLVPGLFCPDTYPIPERLAVVGEGPIEDAGCSPGELLRDGPDTAKGEETRHPIGWGL